MLKEVQLAEGFAPEVLVDLERRFGGRHAVRRRRRSPFEIRRQNINWGGDRMDHHGYAEVYARFLPRFAGRDNLTIVEVGVLRGVGLAMWSALFPHAHIIGLDIDLSHMREALPDLKKRGAFAGGDPELHEVDQFTLDQECIGRILGDRRVDLSVDDGVHSKKAARRTLDAFRPYFSVDFAHFVEDIKGFSSYIDGEFPGLKSDDFGKITVIHREST